MEGFYYSTLVLILTTLIILGIVGISKKDSSKSRIKNFIYLFIIIIPIMILFWNPITKPFKFKPNEKELIGKYLIVKADNEIPKEEFKNYVLELNSDKTFSITPTPGIDLCESGNYELDYDFEYNELSFQCGLDWSPKHIKRKINGFEIEFFLPPDSGKSICFEKIK